MANIFLYDLGFGGLLGFLLRQLQVQQTAAATSSAGGGSRLRGLCGARLGFAAQDGFGSCLVLGAQIAEDRAEGASRHHAGQPSGAPKRQSRAAVDICVMVLRLHHHRRAARRRAGVVRGGANDGSWVMWGCYDGSRCPHGCCNGGGKRWH